MQKTPSGIILNNSAWLWIQQVVDMLLAFGFAWLAMRSLGPAGFGVLTLTQAILNIAGLSTLNLELPIIRFIPEFRQNMLWRTMQLTLAWMVTAKAALAGMAVIVLLLIAPSLGQFYHNPELVIALRVGCLSLFAAAMADVGAAICLSLTHPEVRAALTTLRRAVEIIGLLIVTALGVGLVKAVAVLAIADSVAAIGYGLAAWVYLSRDPPSSSESIQKQQLFKRLFAYTLPLMGARLTEISGREIGKLFLGRIASAEVLGFYSVARLVAERLMALLSQAPLAALPILSGQWRSAEQTPESTHPLGRLIHKLVNYQLIAAGFFGLALAVLAPGFAIIVGGADYQSTIPALRAVMLTTLVWAGVASLHVLFLAGERPVGIFYLNLIYILTTLLAYAVLIPFAQAVGAVLADGLGQIGSLILGLWLGKRWFGFNGRQAGRNMLRIGLPVLLLTLPVYFLPTHILLMAGLLGGLVGLYATYLLALDYFDEAAWSLLERALLSTRYFAPGQRPVSAWAWLLNGIKAYQAWLKSHRLFIHTPSS